MISGMASYIIQIKTGSCFSKGSFIHHCWVQSTWYILLKSLYKPTLLQIITTTSAMKRKKKPVSSDSVCFSACTPSDHPPPPSLWCTISCLHVTSSHPDQKLSLNKQTAVSVAVGNRARVERKRKKRKNRQVNSTVVSQHLTSAVTVSRTRCFHRREHKQLEGPGE